MSFVCRVGNEAVSKNFFKNDAEELTFGKAVAMAAKTEDVAKAAKLTTYVAEATDANMPIYNADPVKSYILILYLGQK